MKQQHVHALLRVSGLVLIILGMLFFLFSSQVAFAWGIFAIWASALLIAIGIGLGVFLILEIDLRYSMKSLLLAVLMALPWSFVFLVPFSTDLQVLFAVVVAFVEMLLYGYCRRYFLKPLVSHENHLLIWRIAGISAVILSLILFYFDVYVAIGSGLFTAWLLTLPISMLFLIGCSLIARTAVGRIMGAWIGYMTLTIMPWIVVLPFEYQVIATAAIGTAIVLAVYQYRQMWKSERLMKRRDIETMN